MLNMVNWSSKHNIHHHTSIQQILAVRWLQTLKVALPTVFAVCIYLLVCYNLTYWSIQTRKQEQWRMSGQNPGLAPCVSVWKCVWCRWWWRRSQSPNSLESAEQTANFWLQSETGCSDLVMEAPTIIWCSQQGMEEDFPSIRWCGEHGAGAMLLS